MQGTIGMLLGMVGIGGPLAKIGYIRRNTDGQVNFVNVFKKKVTDAELVHLKGLTELQTLSFSDGSQITDAGLVHIQGLTNLEILILDNTQISDAGLVHLKGLTNLRHLVLEDTQVTDAGLAAMQQTLPTCEISK